jgi:ribonucleotide monophosphatase NagD (HAD superfamily)
MNVIAIDFDGTIVEDKYPEIGELKDGARETINALSHEGYFIIIWTCRTGEKMLEAEAFLRKNGVRFDAINESSPENLAKYNGNDTRKVHAHIYIDDSAVTPLPHWNEIYQLVHNKLPTYADMVSMDDCQ